MRIAIDLTPIPSQKTGVGKYAMSLIDTLAEQDRGNHYWLFVKKAQRQDFDPQKANFHLISCSNIIQNRIVRVLWEQLVLPLRLITRRIELLHSIHYTTPIVAACKRVVTFHDMTFFLFPDKHTLVKRIFFRLSIPLSAKIATRLIAVSRSTKTDMEKVLNVPENKIDVIHETVDFAYRPLHDAKAINRIKWKYGIQDKYILYVGTLEPRKNIGRLIQAYGKLVLENRITQNLVIAGKKGWAYQEIYDVVEKLSPDCKKKIIFTGYVQEADLPLLYSGADLFVYPSLYEGFGIPPLEAMACGVPTISSKVSSLPEVVGGAGILVDPYDVEELAQSIHKVLTDEELREQLRQKGVRKAQEFSSEKLAKEMLKTYRKALKGG